MLTFLTIERPDTANLRPCRWAILIACWMRWMCEANEAISTRPFASAKIWWKAWPTWLSEPVLPSTSMFVESPISASTPSSPMRASLVDVGDAAVDRALVELVVARVDDRPQRRADDDRERVGNAVAHGAEADLERPQLDDRVVGHLVDLGRLEQAVLVELRLRDREGETARVDRRVDVAQHERQGAVVVFVAVRDEEAEDVVAALTQVADVGQHEVDAEHVVAREGETAVDDDDLAVVFDRGHVLADLPHASQGDDLQGFGGQLVSVCQWVRPTTPRGGRDRLTALAGHCQRLA